MPGRVAWFPLTLVLLTALPAPAQRPRWPPAETVEPPLAAPEGADGGVQPAALREPQTLPPAMRMVEVAAPVISLRVLAPNVAAAGKDTELRLVVENTSRVPARHVTVVYALPQGVRFGNATPPPAAQTATELTWTFDGFAAATRKDIQLSLAMPTEAADVEHRARITVVHDQTTRSRLSRPTLAVRKTGPAQAQQHDILVFALEVKNTSDVELTDVEAAETLPDGLEFRPEPNRLVAVGQPQPASNDPRTRTWPIGRLRPGEMRKVEYHVIAQKTGEFSHGGGARAAAGAAQAQASPAKVTVRELQLELQVTAPPREPADRPARVQVRLRNLSPRQLDNIVVTDQLLDSCKLDGISGGGQQFDNRVQWIVQSLRPNETRDLQVLVRNPAGGAVRHQVQATYRGLTKAGEAVTTFDATPALAWELRASTPAVEVNGEVTFTLTARNTGAGPATNVRPAFALAEELAFVQSAPASKRPSLGRVEFDSVTVPTGGTVTFSVQAKALRAAVAARVEAEVAADVYTAGPVRKQEAIAIGGTAR